MPKSKYPQQLDTSIELPPVRDNILEVGSDVINSLRSAIFNIEKTLGLNPQGSVGNSVAERISKSLDANGNIKKEALDRSNVLSGPIVDSDVSTVASIKESKLKLDFPTKVLQDEISTLSSNLDSIISSIEDLSLSFSVHINPAALNRHNAKSISVAAYNSLGSDTAIKDISAADLQSTFESLFDSHINYTGQNLTSLNNSHSANQIYFDNTNVSGSITANNLQDTIEQIANFPFESEQSHQRLLHSNGILRSASIVTSTNNSFGNVLAEDVSVSFAKSSSNSADYVTINISESVPIGSFNLEKSDIVTLSNLTNSSASYIGSYEIVDFQVTSGNLTTITVWGYFKEASTTSARAKISKRVRKESNLASLLIAPREEGNKTSARSVQICNPNSVKVISSKINPMEITLTNRYLNISINEGPPVTLNLFTSSLARQNIDSIVSTINEQCAEEAYPFLSYRLDLESGGSELVIAHNLPDSNEEQYTITISRASDNGIDAAGFSHVEDLVVKSDFGTNYYINGTAFDGLAAKVNSSSFLFLPGSTVITSGTGVDLVSLGIKRFDIITISGSQIESDDGSYVITSVNSNQITLDTSQLPSGFAGASLDTTKFRIFSNIASFSNITFDKVSGTYGSSLCDIFLDKNRDVFINKLFEHDVKISGVNSLITLVDFDGQALDAEYDLVVEKFADYITLSMDGGPKVEVRGFQNYAWVKSGSYNSKFKFYIPDINLITSISSLVVSGLKIYGFNQENIKTNLKIARVPYDNYSGNGRIVGSNKSGRIISKLERGNIGKDEISTEAINYLINTPREETRSNGVVKGLEILNPVVTGFRYIFDVQSGVCYVNGKRFEIEERISFKADLDASVSDKIFIGIDDFGNIIVQESSIFCSAPFEPSMICILGTLEYNGSNVYFIDQRLFINDLDLKVLNSITVSPQIGMGHFTDLGKALQYAKRFSQAYPRAGIPTVHLKSGIYNIVTEFDNSGITYAAWLSQSVSTLRSELFNGLANAGLLLDFSVNITGEGDSTELVVRNKFIYSDVTYNYKGTLSVVGDGVSTAIGYPTSRFKSGLIRISNLKMNNSKISLFDLNIVDGSDILSFLVEVDSVTFDHQNFESPNPLDDVLTSISLIEAEDLVNEKGNLTVNNCRFIPDANTSTNSAINIGPAIARVRNLHITNNKLYNSITGAALINKDIVTTSIPSTYNILLLGNMSFGSIGSGSRAEIYTGSGLWSDRISQKLTVGENVISEDFSYPQEKTISEVFTFKDTTVLDEFIFNSVFVTAPSVNRQIFTNSDYSYNITYANIPNLASVSIPINKVVNNCKIKTIEIGIPLVTSGSYNINLKINKLDRFFRNEPSQNITDFQETKVGTFSATPSTKRIAILSFDLSSSNVMVDKDSFYYIQVKNLDASDVKLYFATVILSFTNVSDGLGII